MALWSCPHCGAVQAASSRCWVCHRSSTTCSTCRHFRTSLAAAVGWCALDRSRRPLTGLEHRGCWAERPAGTASTSPATPRPPTAPDPGWRELRGRSFVPVDAQAPQPRELPVLEVPIVVVDAPEPWDPTRLSLFGEVEP